MCPWAQRPDTCGVPTPGEGPPPTPGPDLRILLAVGVAVLVIGGVALIAAGGGGGSGGGSQLVVERTVGPTGSPELLISVQGGAGRDPAVARRPGRVGLECLDRGSRVVLGSDEGWPFVDDGTTPLPHVHKPAPPQQLDAVVRCRLTGTSVPLEGAVKVR